MKLPQASQITCALSYGGMFYRVIHYVSSVGFALAVVSHLAAYCGYALVPHQPWRSISACLAGAMVFLSLWKHTDAMRQWMKNGPRVIRYASIILMFYAVVYMWLDLLTKVTGAPPGYASRPVLAGLISMNVHEYKLFSACSFSAMLMFLFFLAAAQSAMICHTPSAAASR